MLRTAIHCQTRFQLGDLGPHDILAMLQNASQGAIDLRANALLLCLEIDE